MQLDINKEKLCINQLVGQKNEIIEIEGDVIVNDIKPDILSIISVKAKVHTKQKEVLDSKVRIDGVMFVDIIYLADDETGSVRSLNTFIDFNKFIDLENCKSGMDLDEKINVKNLECKILNSRKVNVKAFADLNVKLYSNDNVDIINNLNSNEGVQYLNDTLSINSLVGMGSTKAIAKDSIIVDNTDNVVEILRSDIRIRNKDMKISYNKVLAKADVEAKIVYLTDDNRIKIVKGTIPAMGFIDIPNVSDTSVCNTNYKIRNVSVKPNDIQEHSIYVEVETEITCYAYEKKQINVIQDLYSPTNAVNFSKKQITALISKEQVIKEYTMPEMFYIPELENAKISDVFINPIIQKQNIRNGGIDYEGEIELEFLYETNRLESKTIKEPFMFSVDNKNITETTSIETNIEIKTADFILQADGNVQSKIELEFELNITENERINIIDNIEISEKQDSNKYSMIIYFVKPKDTLWEIAKKFDSTIDEIAKVNEIEDTNKITPGMQLFIPRYCSRKTA